MTTRRTGYDRLGLLASAARRWRLLLLFQLGLCWSCSGMTLRSESGILSWPALPLASLPPELDVPLPLREELFVVAPEFGAVEGFAELAAGSPVTEPRPLGPPCACARPPESAIATNTPATVDFMRGIPFRFIQRTTNRHGRMFQDTPYRQESPVS